MAGCLVTVTNLDTVLSLEREANHGEMLVLALNYWFLVSIFISLLVLLCSLDYQLCLRKGLCNQMAAYSPAVPSSFHSDLQMQVQIQVDLNIQVFGGTMLQEQSMDAVDKFGAKQLHARHSPSDSKNQQSNCKIGKTKLNPS